MPFYLYQCSTCSNEFEELRKVHEDTSHAPCPSCGAEAEKKLATGSFKFKGGSPTGSRPGV